MSYQIVNVLSLANRNLQRLRLVLANIKSERDSVRNEKKKQKEILDEMKDLSYQKKMSIDNFNCIVTNNEQEAVRLRKRYEECAKERNSRGIQLIKRSEEVCIICEKSNAQESIVKNGNIELQAREEEIRFLKVRIEEEKRLVDLYRKQLPNEEALSTELKMLRKQVCVCGWERVWTFNGHFSLSINFPFDLFLS
jgi:hypothetical protein